MRELYIQQKVFKITDHYPIVDSEGRICYQVDEDFRFFGHTVHVTRPDGSHLFTVDKEIITWLPRFKVHFSDGRELSLRSRFAFFRKQIDIDPDRLGLRLEGNFWDRDFTVFRGNQILGSIHKGWFTWGDYYELKVIDERYEELFIAVVIAVDCIIDNEKDN